MKKFPALLLALFACALTAAIAANKDDAPSDLDTAIQQATKENKALFIIFGRPTCGNCNALHALIDHHQLRLPKSSFLVANLNCDDPAQGKAFRQRYTVTGNTLPFVVIARPDGAMVSSRTGYGTEKDFNDFIRAAKKQLK